MSMPHTCRCGICGHEMGPPIFLQYLTNGTAPGWWWCDKCSYRLMQSCVLCVWVGDDAAKEAHRRAREALTVTGSRDG